MQKCLVNIRNCCVSNYGVNIIYLYRPDKIIETNVSKLKYVLSCLCFMPFKLLSKFIKYYNYDIIYTMDNLYYTTNIISNHITPVILSVALYSNINNESSNETKKCLYIDTNVESPIAIPIDNYYNSPTIIKNKSMDISPENNSYPMEISPNNNSMECSPDNKMLNVNECPDDKDITMVELSSKKEIVISDVKDDKDIVMIDVSPKKDVFYDMTTNFRAYNSSIPLWVFIKNENVNLDMYNMIKIKYMLNNKIEIIDINIAQNINKLLYDLFSIVVV